MADIKEVGMWRKLLTNSISGGFATIILTPLDSLKIRLINSNEPFFEFIKNKNNLSSLYKIQNLNLLRGFVINSSELSVYY